MRYQKNRSSQLSFFLNKLLHGNPFRKNRLLDRSFPAGFAGLQRHYLRHRIALFGHDEGFAIFDFSDQLSIWPNSSWVVIRCMVVSLPYFPFQEYHVVPAFCQPVHRPAAPSGGAARCGAACPGLGTLPAGVVHTTEDSRKGPRPAPSGPRNRPGRL